MSSRATLLATFAVAAFAPAAAFADEGMWTFDAFPSAQVKAAHGLAPTGLARPCAAAAVRLTGGCSASLVSA